MNATKLSLIAPTSIATVNNTYVLKWDQLGGEILFATLYTHADSNLYTEGNPNLGEVWTNPYDIDNS
ncbi:hypothetical protein JHW46_05575 [Vibrio splendidus]|nr:hypothetical protein [Vibrio splendidus]